MLPLVEFRRFRTRKREMFPSPPLSKEKRCAVLTRVPLEYRFFLCPTEDGINPPFRLDAVWTPGWSARQAMSEGDTDLTAMVKSARQTREMD